ncbi:hypothetical protein IHE61_31005 [Streptomyces sp. GKU 257-1]|nr:hypothetical protein [Streptomyces sp. GKU 257-1]
MASTQTTRDADRELARQVNATHRTLTNSAVHTWATNRVVGNDVVYCQLGKRTDGAEFLISAMVFNPHGEPIATLSPRSTPRGACGSAERSRHSRPSNSPRTPPSPKRTGEPARTPPSEAHGPQPPMTR